MRQPILLAIFASAISPASSAIVQVTVTGTSAYIPPQGHIYPSEILGNGKFTTVFSYDTSSIMNPTTEMYEDSIKHFNLSFEGGAQFTATGGNLKLTSNDLSIRSLSGTNFPELSEEAYSGISFKLFSSDSSSLHSLPTASELEQGFSPFFTWIFYNGHGVNDFTLNHTGLSAIPEPSVSLLALVVFGLIFRRSQ